VKWFRRVPEWVWIVAMLTDAGAAVYVGHALTLAAGY
jgi:hypothetical protein